MGCLGLGLKYRLKVTTSLERRGTAQHHPATDAVLQHLKTFVAMIARDLPHPQFLAE
jgi:hypothetical protein